MRIAVTSVLFAALASAELLPKGLLHSATHLHRRHNVNQQLKKSAHSVFDDLERRQSPAIPMNATANSDLLASWNATTAQVCSDALGKLGGKASNPAGVAMCYNVPLFDNNTGSFEAEIRLYMLSPAVDPFTNVAMSDMNVGIVFPMAVKVERSTDLLLRKRSVLSFPPVKGLETYRLAERQTTETQILEPLSIQVYLGQIDTSKMTASMTATDMQNMLLPQVSISSKSNPGINTAISSTEASFVNGAFSPLSATMNSTAAAAPFVLPGVTLGIYPIGLIITCIWTGLFFLAVGLGTVGRVQFRDQYRRRRNRDMAAGIKTI